MTAQIPGYHHDRKLSRRSIFIGAAVSVLCAPAIVRATSLMPVHSLILPIEDPRAELAKRMFYFSLRCKLHQKGIPLYNGLLSEREARRMLAHAQAQGWLRITEP